MAAQAIKSAIPSHLKPGNGEAEGGDFTGKHHGKTRSHMVSFSAALPQMLPESSSSTNYAQLYIPLY